MDNMQLHELRINYLKDLISRLPHGNFGTYRGRLVIHVYYDPFDRSVNNKNNKRYYLDSPKGKELAPLIQEYQNLCKELKELEHEWNLLYRIPPRDINYPLEKNRTCILDDNYFDKAKPGSNPTKAGHPIKYKDMILRSKNELAACIYLDKIGREYKTEVAIPVDGFYFLYPDLLINVPEECKCLALEIDGAIDNSQYSYKITNRHKGYYDIGLLAGKDVIFMEIGDSYQFDTELLESLIKSAILASLDDINLPPILPQA